MTRQLSIRDPRAAELAKQLAAQRKTTLENELKRERERVPLPERLARLAEKARQLAGPKGRDVPKEKVDEFWGQ